MPPRGRGGRSYWRGYYGRGRGRGYDGRRSHSRGRSIQRSQSQRGTNTAVPTATPRRAGSVPGPSPSQPPSTPWSQRSSQPPSTPGSTRRPTTAARTRTRGAASTTTGAAYRDQQIICAVTEARGIAATVGLAFVNLSTAEAVLCEIADNQTFVKTLHKLHVFDPSEVLVASTPQEQTSKFRQVLAANLSSASPINGIARKYWDESSSTLR